MLTDEQANEVVASLKTRGALAQPCPSCGGGPHYALQRLVHMVPTAEPVEPVAPPAGALAAQRVTVAPLAVATCQRCAYVMLFSLPLLGLAHLVPAETGRRGP